MRGLLLSSLVFAALLPALILGASSPGNFRLLTQADEPSPLRLWFEPDSLVVSPSQTFTVKLMAESDDPKRPIPRLSLRLRTSGNLTISPNAVDYSRAFVGRTEVAQITVTAPRAGEGEIAVLENSISTSLPDLPAVTSPVKIQIE